MVRRRGLVQAGLVWPVGAAAGWAVLPVRADAAASAEVERLLRQGGVVIAFRHALAPGTFDPPDFRLGACSTQRNLSDEGRAQARRIGAWFVARGLKPVRVRSSPWCRCVETAQLAFGSMANVSNWSALGSPRGASETTNAQSLTALRQALVAAAQKPGFEAWVTHMFVLQDLTGQGSSSGEGLVLRADARGQVEVLARLVTQV